MTLPLLSPLILTQAGEFVGPPLVLPDLTGLSTTSLMAIGAVVVALTPVLMAAVKKHIPKVWRPVVPILLGAMTGLATALTTGTNPFTPQGLEILLAMIGSSATAHSLREAAMKGPVADRVKRRREKALLDAVPDVPLKGDGQ